MTVQSKGTTPAAYCRHGDQRGQCVPCDAESELTKVLTSFEEKVKDLERLIFTLQQKTIETTDAKVRFCRVRQRGLFAPFLNSFCDKKTQSTKAKNCRKARNDLNSDRVITFGNLKSKWKSQRKAEDQFRSNFNQFDVSSQTTRVLKRYEKVSTLEVERILSTINGLKRIQTESTITFFKNAVAGGVTSLTAIAALTVAYALAILSEVYYYSLFDVDIYPYIVHDPLTRSAITPVLIAGAVGGVSVGLSMAFLAWSWRRLSAEIQKYRRLIAGRKWQMRCKLHHRKIRKIFRKQTKLVKTKLLYLRRLRKCKVLDLERGVLLSDVNVLNDCSEILRKSIRKDSASKVLHTGISVVLALFLVMATLCWRSWDTADSIAKGSHRVWIVMDPPLKRSINLAIIGTRGSTMFVTDQPIGKNDIRHFGHTVRDFISNTVGLFSRVPSSRSELIESWDVLMAMLDSIDIARLPEDSRQFLRTRLRGLWASSWSVISQKAQAAVNVIEQTVVAVWIGDRSGLLRLPYGVDEGTGRFAIRAIARDSIVCSSEDQQEADECLELIEARLGDYVNERFVARELVAKMECVGGSARISDAFKFDRDSHRITATEKTRMIRFLDRFFTERVSSVKVFALTSPDGAIEHNRTLASDRLRNVKNTVSWHPSISGIAVEVVPLVEDHRTQGIANSRSVRLGLCVS